MKKTIKVIEILFFLFFISSCTLDNSTTENNEMNYTVEYHGNGHTSGTVPVDDQKYLDGDVITVKGGNNLEKKHYIFIGWSNSIDGKVVYKPGNNIKIEKNNIVLYAQWKRVYSVQYSLNGGTGEKSFNKFTENNQYENGAKVILPNEQDLFKKNHEFVEWNTKEDGTGGKFLDTKDIEGENVILYATWKFVDISNYIHNTTNPSGSRYIRNGLTYFWIDGDEENVYVSKEDQLTIQKAIIPKKVLGYSVKLAVGAFAGCINLETVLLPEDLEEISTQAFAGCNMLKKIDIPKTVQVLNKEAFVGSGITEIILPQSLIKINEHAFASCKSLQLISLPESLEYIGPYSFAVCDSLERVSIKGSKTIINDAIGAFFKCKKLNQVDIIESNCSTKLPDKIYYECESLVSISLPNNLVELGDSVFRFSGLESIELPNYVMEINSSAFASCLKLKRIRFSSNEAPTLEKFMGDIIVFNNISECTLEIKSGSTGFNTYPWTDTTKFSEVVNY